MRLENTSTGRHREMTNDNAKYAGRWILIPELCLYEENQPPRSGVYHIAVAADRVHIALAWETMEGTSHKIDFGGPIDGSLQPTGTTPVTHSSFHHIDELTLDSSAYSGDTRIAYARRRVSADGTLLVTVQENRRPDGSTFRNFQVYRREAPPNETSEPTP